MVGRDAALLGRIANGDRAALEELYTACAGSVLAYLLSRNLNRQEAADVLQEVFLAAWRNAGRYEGEAKPLTWLIGIARHKLADHYRRAASPLFIESEPSHDPLKETAEKLTLRQAVAALATDDRELIELVFTRDMSYAEAAEILGVPEGTVKSRMYRIKRELAARMGG